MKKTAATIRAEKAALNAELRAARATFKDADKAARACKREVDRLEIKLAKLSGK